MVLSGVVVGSTGSRLTGYMAAIGEGDEGSGESQETVTDVVYSPTPSKSETPMIMWI